MKTQNVLVFTFLCIGILTVLTAAIVSQSLPALADKKCKHNGEKTVMTIRRVRTLRKRISVK